MEKLVEDLINYLNERTKEYDEGKPTISDEDWDKVYFELKDLEKKFGYALKDSPTQKISYKVKSKLNKVKHNHRMGSLDKTKNWDEFLNYFSNLNASVDVIGMPKLDGLTCSLRYLDGKLISAETRGDGEIGEDILHNARTLSSIPQIIDYKDELILDGEVLCTYKNFESFRDEYKNPRNFASGSIRLLDANECKKRKLTFVVWNIVKGFEEENSFMKKLIKIENLGFTIVPFTSSYDWDAKEYLIDSASQLEYPIDGLVGRFDDVSYGRSLGETEHHSRAAYAFKFYDESYPSTLLGIEWGLGRTGQLTPVAVFEPIEIDGSVCEKASLHNISIMDEISGGIQRIGDTVYIYKANAIIPQVAKWEHCTEGEELLIPEVCPVCRHNTNIIISDSGVKTLICSNPHCEGKLITQLDLFCGKKGLDIKGLSEATLEKLIDWGWVNCLSDIFKLSQYRKEWVKKAGFGQKSVDNILDAIEKSKTVKLENFIASLGIPLIGKTVSKELVKHIKTYEEFRDKVKSHFDFSEYEGFADSKTSAIWNYDFTEADKIYSYLTVPVEDSEVESNTSLNGVTVVITGKLEKYKNRAEFQSAVEAAGGKVVGSVSKKTNYLVNNDSSSNSSKNLTAQKLGIPILTEEEFIKKFF
jgi:DNA ligase (NAD+)